MKKTLIIITLLLIALIGLSDHERINIKSDFIILNGDTIRFKNQSDGMMIYRVGGKWVNVPDTFLRDSIHYNGRWYRQGDTLEFTFPPADSTFIELDDTPDSYPANDYGYGLIAGREEVKFSQMFGFYSTGTWVRTVGDENIVSQRFNSTWGGDALYLANNLNADLVDVEFYEDLSGLGIKFLNENSKITLYINDGLVPNTFAEFVFTTGTSSGNGTDEEWHIVANGVDYGWRAAWAYQAPRLAIGNNTSLEIEITLRSSRIYPRSKGSFMTYTHASVGKPSRSLKIVDDNHNTIYSMPGYIGSPGMPLVADEGTTQLKWANKIWIDTLIANVVLTDFVNNFIGDTIYLPSIRVDTIYMGDTPVNLESDSIFYKDKWLANGDTLTVVETDPVYSASSWKTTTNNSANWNTAYGWGNHAGLYRPIGYVPAWSEITSKPSFATVATSGSYADLSNKPSIPSITNLATKAALSDTAAQLRSEIPDVSNFITGYTETDPVYSASSWKTTTNNSANWNTAYGWGNHAGLYRPIGYVPAWSEITSKPSFATVATSGSYADLSNKPSIPSITNLATKAALSDTAAQLRSEIPDVSNFITGYTETDPVYSASSWKTTTNNSANWNTAYGWGNHAGLYRPIGYVPAWSEITSKPSFATVATSGSYADLSNKPSIPSITNLATKAALTDTAAQLRSEIPDVSNFITGYTETDPLYNASSWKTTTNNSANWNTAYGWGNHAGLYRPIGYVPAWSEITSKPSFATVATSGSYADLSNKPTIPDVSGFISSETDPKVRAGTISVNAGISTIYFNSEFGNSWYVVNATGMKNGNEDIHVWLIATNKAYFTIDVVSACTITYSAIKY